MTARQGTPPTPDARPHWREGQLLRAGDLDAEQQYRLAARRRHDRGAHHWGIVTGLGLELTPAADGFRLQPGVAVDGYGRSLVVTAPCTIPGAVLDELKTDDVDVWLLWRRSAATPARPGHSDCGPGRHTRWQESTWVRLERADQGVEVDGRRPPGVAVGDRTERRCEAGLPGRDPRYAPERPAPDDPDLVWPVYLGRLGRRAGALQEPQMEGRPDAGLTGEAVTSPVGKARMQVGSELPGDRRRFAVELSSAGGPRTDRLTIDARGRVTANGDARLEGDLILAGSEGTARGVEFGRRTASPEEAAPWQLYRTAAGDAAPVVEQLRMEIGNPGEKGDPKRHQLVIGRVGATGIFEPCLTVRSDCTVEVAGCLTVEGLEVIAPAEADPEDPRLSQDLVRNWLTSVVATGVELDEIFASALAVEVPTLAPDPPEAGQQLSYVVRLGNQETIPISALVAIAVISLDGLPVDTAEITAGATLPAGGTVEATRTFDVPADAGGKLLTIGVSAGGLVPFGLPVQADVSRSVAVEAGGG